MNAKISSLKPKLLWHYFAEISKIPRESLNTKPISEYLMTEFKKLGYNPIKDHKNNVFVRKEASSGLEGKPSVLLQAHSDMVCVKTPTSKHNFTKDPITLNVEQNFVRAKDTSLGADNGIGVAMILSIFADKTLKHGPLEALITTDEEIGLLGIKEFDVSNIKSKLMINLDWERGDEVIVGCPGFSIHESKIPLERHTRFYWFFKKFHKKFIKISITGGAGGHSGLDIIEKRINAIKLMVSILSLINVKHKLMLADIPKNDKNKYNVIPSNFSVCIYAKASALNEITQIVENELKIARSEYPDEFGIQCSVEEIKQKNKNKLRPIYHNSTKKIIEFITILPNGIYTYNKKYQIAETSSSIGRCWTDKKNIYGTIMIRSPYDETISRYVSRIENLLSLVGGSVFNDTRMHGWLPKDEFFADTYVSFCQKQQKREIKKVLAPGGVEPLFICYKRPDISAIAIGPNLWDVHSTNEHLDIDSTQKLFAALIDFLHYIAIRN